MKKPQDAKQQFSEELTKVVALSDRVPYASKAAHNFRWAKAKADALDIKHPDVIDPEYKDRVEDNYRLMNGLPMVNYTKEAYRTSMVDEMSLKSEGIDVPNLKLEHFDFVSPFIDGLWGDQKRRRLKFTVTDSSKFTQNYIKQHKEESLKNHFETKLVAPAREYAMMKWQMDNGVTDLFSLNDAERQRLQQEVNASMETLIPKDVMHFLNNGAQGSIEKQGQALAEALVATMKLKYKIDEAYRHSFATDGVVFYSGIRRNKVYTRMVDLSGFNTGGTDDIFVDKNAWFKEVVMMHPSTIWTQWGDIFTREDVKRLDEMVGHGGTEGAATYKDDKFVMAIDYQGQEMLSRTNLLTEEGQQQYSKIKQKYQGSSTGDFDDIRVAFLTWLSLDKFKEITRGYGDGTVRIEYFTEDYVFNPLLGDLEERTIWVPRYWQATKIGEGSDPIFVDCGPVPYQQRDITDPYEVRSPYTGGFLHDMSGKGYRRSPLDKVKPFIHAINFQMKTIKEREATDIGKVVLMTVAAKPKGWTWGKLIEVVRATKMLPIDTQKGGLTAADVQFFRSVDLGNLFDILPRINYLMFLIQRVGEGLSSNAARQGNPAASTSVGNNTQNLNRSFSQTHGRASWIDAITENLLENLIYLAKSSVRNGNIFLRYVLDDLSIANIDIDIEEIDDAYYGVKVSTDDLDMDKIDVGKNILLPYIQGKGLSFQLAMETVFATSRGEFMHVASKAEMEAQMKDAAAMDFQKMSIQETEQKRLETEAALLELKSNLKMQEDAPNIEAKKEMAALQSMTIAHGNDINQNSENDYTESAREEREFKREELLIKDALERDKLALEDQWTAAELEVLKDKVKAMAVAKKTPPKAKKK